MSKISVNIVQFFSHTNVVRDLIVVASPVIVLSIIGNLIGLSTVAGGAVINLGYVLMIILGWFVLKCQGSSWYALGLMRPTSWPKTVLLGVAIWVGAIVVFVVTQMIVIFISTLLDLAPSEIDQSRFNPLANNLLLLLLMIALSWTTIAFGEELFYRAFLITRLVDYTRIGHGLSILISGTVFGLVHFAEGVMGILSNGAFGILFGWIYLRSKRNLWITIVAHGLLNTMRFGLLYSGAI